VAAFIEAAASKFESDDLEEFLAAMEPQTVTTAIDWLKEVEHKPGRWSVLPAIEDCRQAVRFRRAPTKPWTIGYASARKVRKQLQFSDYQPVGELSALGKRLGNPLFHATEKSPAGLRAVSYVPRGNPQAIVGGGRRPEAVLFATTRTVGDAIHFGAPRYSPVTDQQGTYRQMLGRAFAAEFLAPVKEVLEMRERGEAVEDIAAHFGVGEMVISHQIENAPNSLEA
jgi:hypothetical protein